MSIHDHDGASAGEFAGIRALRSREAGYSVAHKCLDVQFANAGHITAPLHEEARSWYLGALGEVLVGKVLQQLPSDWLVLHSVPFGSAETDIDHLLISERGVYCLNTKNHRGAGVWVGDHQLRVNNHPQDYLRASLGEASRVAKRLQRKVGDPPLVTPMLVMVNPRYISDKREQKARRPAVVDAKWLLQWLNAQPRRLSEVEADLLKLVAEEPDTWHVDATRAESFRIMQRFERLHAAVGEPKPPQQRGTATSRQASGSETLRSLAKGCLSLAITVAGLIVLYNVLTSFVR